MTYLVLARKWRPRSFETLVGQDHVVRALTHALDSQRLHHAWLFTGTRGVGKTTLSRILAKSLNCETGITSRPCGTCRACTEIDSGRFVDYIELDAASNRGVEEMSQLLEQAVYAPSVGRFKVYMIDEVHMLTGHAFNAMLKTLEEPPPHVKFILATTDPQKIPVTVLSRCLQFNLKQMPPDAIVGHLQMVLGDEAIPNELPALRLIAQAASGSMRDALSLTDQAIAYSASNLTEEAVRGMLGTIDQRHLVRLLESLSVGQASGVLAVAEELSTRGLSYAGALADLAVLLSRVAIEQRVTGATSPEDPLSDDIVRLAQALHPDAVQLFYSVAVHSRSELSLAPDEHAGFIMACLRMLALNGQAGPQAALQSPPPVPEPRVERSPVTAVAEKADVVVATPVQDKPAEEPVPAPAAQTVPPWEDLPVVAQPETAAAVDPVPRDRALTVPPVATQVHAPDVPSDGPPAWVDEDIPDEAEGGYQPSAGFTADPDDDFETLATPGVSEVVAPEPSRRVVPSRRAQQARASLAGMASADWPALAAKLPVTGLAAEVARQSEWAGVQGDAVILRVAVKTLAESESRVRLQTVLCEHFGQSVRLEIEVGATGEGTAHAVAQIERAARQQAAEDAVAADPFVLALQSDFGGRVGMIRVIESAAPAS